MQSQTDIGRAEKQAASAQATKRALAVLRPGDLLHVRLCADQTARYLWKGEVEHGCWLVCHPRLRDHIWSLWHFRDFAMPKDDVHAHHIISVNGRLVDFRDEGSR